MPMQRRAFGRTGLFVSERSFGAWAIGGASFGRVEPAQAIDALARAEELGCNFVDTAAVYGESEAILGRFLPGRRDRWIVANKYSKQAQGMTALVEEQLRRLGTDRIDLHQLHWAPRGDEGDALYDELLRLKAAGKIRHAGVSLRTAADIDDVLARSGIDAIQLPVSLLDPDPIVARRPALRERGIAVIARSALKSGFLTGKYAAQSRFDDRADQRHEWCGERIAATARQAAAFGWLARPDRSLGAAAIAYPLSFAEVSTVILSCKSVAQVDANLGGTPARLDAAELARITTTQAALGVTPAGPLKRAWRRVGAMFGMRR